MCDIFLFIADRVKSKEVWIEYCTTGIMTADYFTKPLQGLLFRQMQDMIMGKTEIALPTDKIDSASSGVHPTRMQECVEKQECH